MRPTKDQALSFRSQMASLAGAIMRDRTQAIEIKAIGAAFDTVRLLHPSIGLPDGSTFVRDFATTLGPVIYENPALADQPDVLMEMMTHECQHVHQWHTAATKDIRQDGLPYPSELAFPILFLKDDQAVAQWESDAYAAGESVRFRITGYMRSPEEVAALLSNSYSVGASGKALCLSMMLSHRQTILETGRVNVWSAIRAHTILDAMGFPASFQP